MLDMDSLPPMSFDGPNAVEERSLAKQVFEYAVLLSVGVGDKEGFNKHMSCLRPYYNNKRFVFGLFSTVCISSVVDYLSVKRRNQKWRAEY